MNEKIIKLSELVMVMATLFMVYVGYLLYYPFKTNHSYTGDTLHVINKKLHAGEALKIEVDVEQYTSGIKVDKSTQIVNGVVFNLPNSSYITRKGRMTFTQYVVIPKEIQPGVYHLEFDSTFNINPLRKIMIHRKTENFTILGEVSKI